MKEYSSELRNISALGFVGMKRRVEGAWVPANAGSHIHLSEDLINTVLNWLSPHSFPGMRSYASSCERDVEAPELASSR